METSLHNNSQAREYITHASLAKGIGWGSIGGVIGTLVMDLILMGVLSALGKQALSCFLIVGDTVMHFFSLLGMDMAGGVPLGIATHYIVGPVVGAIFGAAVTQVNQLRAGTLKKRVMFAVLYVEILSQPMLVMTPVLLQTSTSETFVWFGGSFIMHLIWGVVLGVVLSLGLRLATAETHKR